MGNMVNVAPAEQQHVSIVVVNMIVLAFGSQDCCVSVHGDGSKAVQTTAYFCQQNTKCGLN